MNQNSRKIICLIPARRGSQGLRHKNLRRVGLYTITHKAIKVARKIDRPVYIVLSTDDTRIIRRYSRKVDLVIHRDPQLSTSESPITLVILDALKRIEHLSGDDLLLLLEPSSPNRNISDVNKIIEKMINEDCGAIATISLIDSKFHPYKLLKTNDNHNLVPWDSDSPSIVNRQQIKSNVYYRNGIAYMYRIRIAQKLTSTLPINTKFIVTDRWVANIDNEIDLWMARYLNLKMNINKLLYKSLPNL